MTKTQDSVGAIAEISVTMTVEEWTTIMARIANRTMSPTGARIYKRAAARMCDQIAHGAEAAKAAKPAPLGDVLGKF
jgi:hypothetical protein